MEKNVKVFHILFHGRKNIAWKNVKDYLKKYQGQTFEVTEYNDVIKVNLSSIDEYTSSRYTRNLRGTLAKVKANITQVLPDLISNAGSFEEDSL